MSQTLQDARIEKAARPPSDAEIADLISYVHCDFHSAHDALTAFLSRRNAPPAEIRNEVEIRWAEGKVTAGPFIRERVRWTPEQAEQFADLLRDAAQKAAPPVDPRVEKPVGLDDVIESLLVYLRFEGTKLDEVDAKFKAYRLAAIDEVKR